PDHTLEESVQPLVTNHAPKVPIEHITNHVLEQIGVAALVVREQLRPDRDHLRHRNRRPDQQLLGVEVLQDAVRNAGCTGAGTGFAHTVDDGFVCLEKAATTLLRGDVPYGNVRFRAGGAVCRLIAGDRLSVQGGQKKGTQCAEQEEWFHGYGRLDGIVILSN
uniref:Uncharacterized protein n=1 Tax=Anopheles coluzzii TaxID=1518534 RepID=A0A6E8VS29_ANOCL